MTFFERYFERLDGPDPHRALELVSDDCEFSIQWAAGEDRKSTQFLGGVEELRGFTDAGDTTGWAHHVVWSGTQDDVEFALGETRWDDERRTHRHVSLCRAARRRRLHAPLHGRSHARPRVRQGPTMPELDFVPVADGLIAGTAEEPRLIGSECRRCGTVTFPRQGSCPRCTSQDVAERLLARRGTLWTWTIQCFPPKSPPYAGDKESFEPYGVGYVELPGEVRVETLLTDRRPAAPGDRHADGADPRSRARGAPER